MNYTFQRHPEAAFGDGFNYPIDVIYGTIYLGTLVARSNGFVIQVIDTPKGQKPVSKSPNNNFKSEAIAAETLHKTWLHYKRHMKE